MQETSHHRVVDLTKIKNQLGYADLYPVEEAIEKTVGWYLANQPERGGEIEKRLQDPFNYAAEDRLIAAYADSMQRVAAIPFEVQTDRPASLRPPQRAGSGAGPPGALTAVDHERAAGIRPKSYSSSVKGVVRP